jgi:predicted DNA-binding transcriptional regulator AlpA
MPSSTEMELPSAIVDEHQVLTLDQTAKLANISPATLRRRLDDGSGPKVIRLSARRVGIRVRDFRAWLDQLAS